MSPRLTRTFATALLLCAALSPSRAEGPSLQSEAAAFRKVCATKAANLEKSYAVTAVGKDGWMFFGQELRHVGVGQFWGAAATKVSQSVQPENADPLPAILDFKKQLDAAGVQLLVVPVPPKALIYPDKLWPRIPAAAKPPARLDTVHQEFYDLLKVQGVDVLDLAPILLANRDSNPDPLYCKQDTHWSGRACALVGKIIADKFRDTEWAKNAPKKTLTSTWKRLTIKGDLWQAVTPQPAQESLPLRFVGTANKNGLPTPVALDQNSPILLLGDSHSLVFHEGDDMHAKGAGLADQLAFEFGFPVDLIGVRGSGATPARVNLMRRIKSNPKYLGTKKLVIWCFSAREFTETMGWQKVPVTG